MKFLSRYFWAQHFGWHATLRVWQKKTVRVLQRRHLVLFLDLPMTWLFTEEAGDRVLLMLDGGPGRCGWWLASWSISSGLYCKYPTAIFLRNWSKSTEAPWIMRWRRHAFTRDVSMSFKKRGHHHFPFDTNAVFRDKVVMKMNPTHSLVVRINQRWLRYLSCFT